jgi:small subunit ribosomal protein S20
VRKSKSVLKRIRQSEDRRQRNRAEISRYKTEVKKLENLIEEKNAEAARAMLPSVAATLDKAASKKAISKNSASRKKSSLARRVNSLA